MTQKALLSGSLSATDAEAVVRCVDAVAAKGGGSSCLPYLEADLLRADHGGGGGAQGDNGEKETKCPQILFDAITLS